MKTPSTVLRDKMVAGWLLICCALIFAIVVLGGVTRLTRSGLSIVEWRLLAGTLPPLTETHWQELFDLYKQTPEYYKINVGMDLTGFKQIFWLEYLHRLWGRLIFIVALVPLLWFLWRGHIAKRWVPRIVTVPLLVALNGVLGWFMVASGLIDIPRVSPYRLTAHLGLAVAIYAYILWVALGLRRPAEKSPPVPTGLRHFAHTVTGLIFLTILSGGFVAGNKAGFAFNTFPWMNGRFVPEGMFALQPVWINFFENIAAVQFDHRLTAYLLCIAIPVLWWYAMRYALPTRTRRLFHMLLGWLVIQVALGIAALLYLVPISLAAAHQAGALILFSLALLALHALRTRA